MIDDGCLIDVKEIYGIHNACIGPECTVSLLKGDVLSGDIELFIEVLGKGGHGSEPYYSRDPITAACMIH